MRVEKKKRVEFVIAVLAKMLVTHQPAYIGLIILCAFHTNNFFKSSAGIPSSVSVPSASIHPRYEMKSLPHYQRFCYLQTSAPTT